MMHVWYNGRMHTPPVGVTFIFSLLDFKKHIYVIFAIMRLNCYACKRTDYKEQYFYANLLLIKILTRKIFLLRIAKFKNNASGRSLQLKKLSHPVSKELKKAAFYHFYKFLIFHKNIKTSIQKFLI